MRQSARRDETRAHDRETRLQAPDRRAPPIFRSRASGAAYAAARLVQSLLFSVSATDVWSFTAGIALLAVTAIAACIIPARRALRLSPMDALRND